MSIIANYIINTEDGSVLSSVDIPRECSDEDDTRPFALKYNDDTVYVGVTCTAYNSQDVNDLKAIIYSYKDESFFKVLEFPLNYEKGAVYLGDGKMFYPWTNVWDVLRSNVKPNRTMIHPQPLLDDIEFIYRDDRKKYMVMSFMDRTGLQTGIDNYDTNGSGNFIGMTGGDLLIASMNSDGTATLESNGTINGYGGSSNLQGPGGGEFFHGDYMFEDHEEVALGGTASIFGSDTIIENSFDPENDDDKYATGGARFFNIADGSYKDGKVLYIRDEDGSQGKSVGIGDIEVITDLAPIEIGNRVWLDKNGDGIQNPNEDGISGVKVELLNDSGEVIATAETDEDGEYIFSNEQNKESSASHIYNISGLVAGSNYTVRIPDVTGDNKQTALKNYILTTADTGEGENPNLNDSDGQLNGNNAEASVDSSEISIEGANNHSFDFGFMPPVTLGSFIWEDTNEDGKQDSGEPGIANVTVELLDESGNPVSDENGNPITTVTDSEGKYFFDDLEAGKYKIRVKVPSDYIPTNNQNTNADDDVENDSNIESGNRTDGYISAVITLNPAGEPTESNSSIGDDQDDSLDINGNMTLDLGFIKLQPLSLGSFIWEDSNSDGLQGADENPISGVEVRLLVKDENGDFVPAQDVYGNEVPQQVTGEDGLYLFENIPEGEYKVETKPPSNYIASPNQNVSGNADSNKEDDSNIESSSDGNYTSGIVVLSASEEPNLKVGGLQEEIGQRWTPR